MSSHRCIFKTQKALNFESTLWMSGNRHDKLKSRLAHSHQWVSCFPHIWCSFIWYSSKAQLGEWSSTVIIEIQCIISLLGQYCILSAYEAALHHCTYCAPSAVRWICQLIVWNRPQGLVKVVPERRSELDWQCQWPVLLAMVRVQMDFGFSFNAAPTIDTVLYFRG